MCRDLEANYNNEKGRKEMIFDSSNQKWVACSLITDADNLLPTGASTVPTNFEALEECKQTDNEEIQPQQKASAINSFGSRVKNLFQWFKKDKTKNQDDSDEERGSDEIDSNEEEVCGKSSHRSADIEEQIAPLECLITTPHSQQIKTLNIT